MVVGGLIGGRGGCRTGHPAGWSVDADQPRQIGEGVCAVLPSLGPAVAGVLLVDLLFWPAPRRRG
jgi:hypothetical protein